ncbi:hypothetical protein N9917_00300 [Deltaproteobacteria bacterium]|nr:hypothetical protein [Deltaproteobacteria bacterium]
MSDTRTLRLCVLQYDDDSADDDSVLIFAAGWDVDPDDHNWQDDLRRKAAFKASNTSDKFLTSVRFVDVEVPVTPANLTLPIKEIGP